MTRNGTGRIIVIALRTVLLAHRPSQEGSYRLTQSSIYTVQNAQLSRIGGEVEMLVKNVRLYSVLRTSPIRLRTVLQKYYGSGHVRSVHDISPEKGFTCTQGCLVSSNYCNNSKSAVAIE
jgi:hypothetical protein